MIKVKINLENYRGAKSRVFSGREEGKKVRKRLQLDHLDTQDQIIEIIIPDDTIAINSSFFLGLFGGSVRALGEDVFRSKYQFLCKSALNKSINDGIQRALKQSTPLE